ncbi:hypothetical protein DM75_2775 [Burkholderia mallei]|nr:hypothetical protein DM75_2775 [Burkholderia mallei]
MNGDSRIRFVGVVAFVKPTAEIRQFFSVGATDSSTYLSSGTFATASGPSDLPLTCPLQTGPAGV